MKRIIIGSPIKQKNKILNEFLLSLSELDLEGLDVHYYFIDDNTVLFFRKLSIIEFAFQLLYTFVGWYYV